jgi:hypothetical protein
MQYVVPKCHLVSVTIVRPACTFSAQLILDIP